MNRIKETLAERGMLSKDLGDLLGIDIHLISKFVNGHCLPTADTLSAMESHLQADRLDLYDYCDLDLLGGRKPPKSDSVKRDRHKPSAKKTYRVSHAFASSIPADVLEVCGYSSWTAWHYAALKRLLGEYAARCKALRKGAD